MHNCFKYYIYLLYYMYAVSYIHTYTYTRYTTHLIVYVVKLQVCTYSCMQKFSLLKLCIIYLHFSNAKMPLIKNNILNNEKIEFHGK